MEKMSPIVYHYCTANAFESIIKSKNIWLTKIINSNDYEEVIHTYDNIWPIVRERLCDIFKNDFGVKTILDKVEEQITVQKYVLFNGKILIPFGVCFSINRDLAQNWNEYGDKSQGIAIGFTPDIFYGIEHRMPFTHILKDMSIGWEYVIYERDQIIPIFVNDFAKLIAAYRNKDIYVEIASMLLRYASFIKNSTFKDEREVRIIYYPLHLHEESENKQCNVSQVIYDKIPHCELPWLNEAGCTIAEIIYGTNCKLSQNDISCLLKENGINHPIHVTQSKYSYRLSENRKL